MIPKNWVKITALCLSLPSTIFAIVFFSRFLEYQKIVSHNLSNIIIIVLIIYILSMIIYYAVRKKK